MISNDTFTSLESQRLRELIRDIGIPLSQLPEILEYSASQSFAWWTGNDEQIKIEDKHFSRVGQLLSMNEDALYLGTYDRDLARKRLHGDYESLPERYLENPHSFLRSSEHIYKYIVLTRGSHFADRILGSINVSPLIYQSTDRLINLTYFADILHVLAKNGFSQHEMDTLSSLLFLSLKTRPLGKLFEASENLHDVYSTLAENYGYFDTNFEYKSEFIGKKYVLTTSLNLNEHDRLRGQDEQLRRLMRYRHILLAWFPYLAGMTPVFPQAEYTYGTDVIKTRYELRLDRGSKQHLRVL